jgi:type IV pilus assembly protein PilA
MHHMQKIQTGFTLPELMIVVAIIGLLASIAIPMANQYSARAKVSEAILATGTCRNVITEYITYNDETPGGGNFACESAVGQPVSRYVDYVQTDDNGIIIVRLSNAFNDLRLNGQFITMAPKGPGGVPATFGGRIQSWRCGSPLDVPTGAITSNATTVNPKFLPSSCNG